MEQMAQLQRRNAEALTDLQVKRDQVAAKHGDTSTLDDEIAVQKKKAQESVDILTNSTAQLNAAEADGMNGVNTAIRNFIDEQ